jgi:hypothetical protein
MEIRLTPDQLKGVNLVQDVARAAGLTLYLTGGAIRDIISGFTIRDLDFTVQGNPLKLQKDFERAGAQLAGQEEEFRSLFLLLPGNVRAEVGMARTERYEKVGKPPVVTLASIQEDLRRRDFTVNAMALSLNEGSRGLLLDPFNGVADIEAKVLRILHNYSFVEDPSRMIRATRFAARFHWPLEERTQQRYDSAKENKYIEHISRNAIGHEIAQLAHEDDPLAVVRALEKEEFLKVLHPHWTAAKVDTNGLSQLMKTRQQLVDLGYTVDPSAAVMHFLTAHLSEKDSAKRSGRGLAGPRGSCQGTGQTPDGKRGGDPFAYVELVVSGASGDDFILSGNHPRASGSPEDQELPYQMARRAEADSAARDDRVADHSAVAGIPQNCPRRIYAVARREIALADGNVEIPQAPGAAAPASTSSATARAWAESARASTPRRGWGQAGEDQRKR